MRTTAFKATARSFSAIGAAPPSQIPEMTEKGFGGGDPLAIYKPTGAKSVSPALSENTF